MESQVKALLMNGCGSSHKRMLTCIYKKNLHLRNLSDSELVLFVAGRDCFHRVKAKDSSAVGQTYEGNLDIALELIKRQQPLKRLPDTSATHPTGLISFASRDSAHWLGMWQGKTTTTTMVDPGSVVVPGIFCSLPTAYLFIYK